MSAWRGVLTGLVSLSTSRRTICVVPTLDKAADWLPPAHHRRTGRTLERDELLAALRAARADQP
jgi:hypothetical protein